MVIQMAFLVPDKIRTEYGLEIKEKIIPFGAVWPRTVYNTKGEIRFKKGSPYKADRLLSCGSGKAEYVTIHNTGVIKTASGTTMAEQYARATWPNANMNDARVHYYIDENDCWQQLREDEVGWHASDGRGPGNEKSIAIEIIMDGSGSERDKKSEYRGALLAAILLKRHHLTIDRLATHKQWSGKNCPMHILPHFDEFRNLVSAYMAQIDKIKNDSAVKPDALDEGEESVIPETADIRSGDLVSINEGATYYKGQRIPSWVMSQKWYVMGDPKGDRAVINKNEKGTCAICSPINVKYLKVIKSASVSEEGFKPYRVKLLSDSVPIHSGAAGYFRKTGDIKDKGVYTITEEQTDREGKTWGRLKSGAGWIPLSETKKI